MAHNQHMLILVFRVPLPRTLDTLTTSQQDAEVSLWFGPADIPTPWQ
jgi:hypothetical protein